MVGGIRLVIDNSAESGIRNAPRNGGRRMCSGASAGDGVQFGFEAEALELWASPVHPYLPWMVSGDCRRQERTSHNVSSAKG